MPTVIVLALGLALIVMASVAFAYLLLRQNGRILIRLEAIERDLLTVRLAGASPAAAHDGAVALGEGVSDSSLAGSRINRDGLTAGTLAPDFTLPTIDGSGSLSLSAFRGRRMLLVFSAADCGPCDVLARRLAQLSRDAAARQVLIVARGAVDAYRQKLARYDVQLPTVIQSAWEISRLYGTFQLPSAYAIDETGHLTSGVVVGADAIVGLACDVLYEGQKQAVLA